MSLISGEKIIAFSNIPSFAGKLILISPLGEIINAQKEKSLEIGQALATINLTINISMAALGVFIFLSSFYLIQKGLVKPIIIFRNAANNISNGKLDTRVSIKSQDEIGELATTFNNMASEMDQSHGDLEQKVTERTQKLDQKVKELEKFKEVTVDRELRMIELKKEIKRLEAKSQVGGEREKV
jgi:nitrate/nitrite-specific signal transduction histidine kinase